MIANSKLYRTGVTLFHQVRFFIVGGYLYLYFYPILSCVAPCGKQQQATCGHARPGVHVLY